MCQRRDADRVFGRSTKQTSSNITSWRLATGLFLWPYCARSRREHIILGVGRSYVWGIYHHVCHSWMIPIVGSSPNTFIPSTLPRQYLAVAQEVHHGHFHVPHIFAPPVNPVDPVDVEEEFRVKLAEAENASVSLTLLGALVMWQPWCPQVGAIAHVCWDETFPLCWFFHWLNICNRYIWVWLCRWWMQE